MDVRRYADLLSLSGGFFVFACYNDIFMLLRTTNAIACYNDIMLLTEVKNGINFITFKTNIGP